MMSSWQIAHGYLSAEGIRPRSRRSFAAAWATSAIAFSMEAGWTVSLTAPQMSLPSFTAYTFVSIRTTSSTRR